MDKGTAATPFPHPGIYSLQNSRIPLAGPTDQLVCTRLVRSDRPTLRHPPPATSPVSSAPEHNRTIVQLHYALYLGFYCIIPDERANSAVGLPQPQAAGPERIQHPVPVPIHHHVCVLKAFCIPSWASKALSNLVRRRAGRLVRGARARARAR
eukprot:scaffold2482_cov131-Isochrysis_galbana.AAC.2